MRNLRAARDVAVRRLSPVGCVVRMRPSGKRFSNGLATVIRHEEVGNTRKRAGLVVLIEGREVWVNQGEVEETFNG